ncbi:MAG: GxxExxY protein [Candidatus Tenebribacter davisii]|jgi:GxxExxY protein|nr:GxxExxY protein [Candidatus Tenebribacter davisii]
MNELKYADLTDKIIGASYKVYNKLGSGFFESVYESCLMIELKKLGLSAEQQKSIQVFYDEQEVGFFIADIVVENKVIIELKAFKELAKVHEVQLVNYLTATGIDVGLLINFSSKEVQVKRKVRVLS